MKLTWEWHALAVLMALIGIGIGALVGDTLAWMAGLGDDTLHPLVFAVAGGWGGYKGTIWLVQDTTYGLVDQPRKEVRPCSDMLPYYS